MTSLRWSSSSGSDRLGKGRSGENGSCDWEGNRNWGTGSCEKEDQKTGGEIVEKLPEETQPLLQLRLQVSETGTTEG